MSETATKRPHFYKDGIAWMGSGVSATGWVILLNSASYIAVLISLTRMREEELTPAVRAAFGAQGDPVRLAGGKGGTWRIGDVVLKPSEVAPLNAILLTEILHEAGVPAGVDSFRIAREVFAEIDKG